MGVQENIEVVRRGYEAFIAGDMVWLHEHLHQNIVWHVPGNNVLSGDYKGIDNVLAFFAKSVSIVLPEFNFHDFTGSEDHVVALVEIDFRRTDNGEVFHDHVVQIFHVDGEKALAVWTMSENPAGFDDFLSGASA